MPKVTKVINFKSFFLEKDVKPYYSTPLGDAYLGNSLEAQSQHSCSRAHYIKNSALECEVFDELMLHLNDDRLSACSSIWLFLMLFTSPYCALMHTCWDWA